MSQQQPGRYQRSAAGMVGAMLVLVLVMLAFVALRDLNRETPEAGVRAVDYEQTVRFARDSADFTVLAPSQLPDGWRATSVEFTPRPGRWHLGLLTDRDRYVGLEQAKSSPADMVETYVDRNAVRGGNVVIDGGRWAVWTDNGGDTALVRRSGDVTTLVVGTVPQATLVEFVQGLDG